MARDAGRLTSAELGLVINDQDPYSQAVGSYYAKKRRLKPEQVIHVSLPLHQVLKPEEFERLKARIDEHFGPRIQALALAWTFPYAVSCNSITGALALGYDPALCQQTCAASRPSPYFNSPTGRPFTDLGVRPSMLLAAGSVEEAEAMIDRGVAADRSLGWRAAPPVHAYFMVTRDTARNVRVMSFPPVGRLGRSGVEVKIEPGDIPRENSRVLLVETGVAHLDDLDTLHWVPGALADHLTSYAGQLERPNGPGGQTTVLAWLKAGATASYGTVTEPCNHLQKFPQPQLLLMHYVQGVSALEAYWKSVAWPQQGLFVGEPLAAPFAR